MTVARVEINEEDLRHLVNQVGALSTRVARLEGQVRICLLLASGVFAVHLAVVGLLVTVLLRRLA